MCKCQVVGSWRAGSELRHCDGLRGPLWRASVQSLSNLCSWMGMESKSV